MTRIINIDALRDPAPFTLIVDGKEHEMKVATVDDFIANMAMMEQLGTKPSMTEELKVMIEIISKAFPTLGREQIGKFQFSALSKIFEIVRGDGQTATNETTDAEGNGQAAS